MLKGFEFVLNTADFLLSRRASPSCRVYMGNFQPYTTRARAKINNLINAVYNLLQ